MIKRIQAKRNELQAKGTEKGFTLIELIIVIAIIGLLAVILLPQFATFTDRTMGTAAQADAKNILTVASAHTAATNEIIDDAELALEIEVDAGSGKVMAVDGGGANVITYTYTNNGTGAVVTATIDVANSDIAYVVDAGGNAERANRIASAINDDDVEIAVAP